jgi:hypothetical protein
VPVTTTAQSEAAPADGTKLAVQLVAEISIRLPKSSIRLRAPVSMAERGALKPSAALAEWPWVRAVAARQAAAEQRLLAVRPARWVLTAQARVPMKPTAQSEAAPADEMEQSLRLAAKVSIRWPVSLVQAEAGERAV